VRVKLKLHIFLTSLPDAETVPGVHDMGGWTGTRVGLDTMVQEETSPRPFR
jgi:hypothetical protein